MKGRPADYWNQAVNERVLHNELKKMDSRAKRELARKLLSETGEKGASPNPG